MPYQPFYEISKELALKETRNITIFEDHPLLPPDEYGLIELYCNDENCDCRRVMFNVISKKTLEIIAVIAYGWENTNFYRQWTTSGDLKIAEEMQGLSLNMMSKQSELAPALLILMHDMVLKDPAYIARLKRHYQMFKEKVDPKHFRPSGAAKQPVPVKPKSRKRH